MFRARHVLHTPGPLWVGHSRPILLVALVSLSLVVGPAVATAQQLNLSWVDNSGGQAGFIIQRATGTGGPYTQIGQVPAGVASYADTAVSFGTTYCYQVAAVEGAEVSAFSDVACGSPSGGFTLTTAKAGTGVGTVAGSPAGITCGTTCSYTYPAGTVVTLTATPSSASTFSSWSGGGCSGTAPCTLVGNGSVTVTATFAALPAYTLTVTKTGPGTVSSSPGGISCGSICSASYASGSVVTLTAVPGSGARFNGWSGGGCTGTGSCNVTLTAATAVTATFALQSVTLTVSRAGTGTGTVTSTPAGITCGTSCSASYSNGTVVTLTAAPASGSTFAGWSGACTGTGACTVTLSANTAVTATLNTSSVTPWNFSWSPQKVIMGSGSTSVSVTNANADLSGGPTVRLRYHSRAGDTAWSTRTVTSYGKNWLRFTLTAADVNTGPGGQCAWDNQFQISGPNTGGWSKIQTVAVRCP